RASQMEARATIDGYSRAKGAVVFLTVVQLGSMAKAAAQFRVKQPSALATIRFLEVAMKLPHRRRFLRLAAGAMRTLAVVLALLVASGLAQIAAVQAADINAFISTAIKAVTDQLLPPFERANGHTIHASYAPSGALLPRFERGEPVDVFLTDAPAIDRLIQQGKIVGGRVDLARTGIAIGVGRGAPGPAVPTPEALRRALLGAGPVGHAPPAGGSIVAGHIQRMFEQLGISSQVTPKVKLAAGGPNGRVSVLVS